LKNKNIIHLKKITSATGKKHRKHGALRNEEEKTVRRVEKI
jgi:hypothetical protein